MAAGLGTRLRPLTEHTPKCLVSIADKPLLDYWFDRFAAASLSDVLINTHHLPILVRNHISSINSGGWSGMPMRVLESFEPALLGSAGTIHQNRNWADDADDVLIVYADSSGSHNHDAFSHRQT
jgi:mannose-1-phosphate guanylyltransferase